MAAGWRHIVRNPMGAAGLFLVAAVLFCALFGPWISPYDPFKIDVPNKFQ